MSNRAQYSQWPFLTEDEFELACAYLDRKYVGARLGPTRKIFKLRVRRTAAVGGAYVDILRLLEPPEEEEELAIALGKLTGGDTVAPEQGNEVEMVDEDQDHEALRPDSGRVHGDAPPGYSIYSHQPYVTYEIHLHPTYRMPTLWFALHDLPMREPTFDLDSVYRYLVPPQYKSSLREMGAMGGISAAPHPLTDVPAFFIHPCQTKEAMEGFDCPMELYLMTWLGLVGGCVGLWVPPEMAEKDV